MEAREVYGYNGKYLITPNGEVISLYRMTTIHGVPFRIEKAKVLKTSSDKRGYQIVNLYDGNGKCKSAKVHRLVACAYIPNPAMKRCVCHKDNNPKNNTVENLYWGTDQENQSQAWRDGLHKNHTKVCQHTKDNKLVKIYFSTCEASRETKIPQSNIWKCLVGKRKTAGGYIWRRLG